MKSCVRLSARHCPVTRLRNYRGYAWIHSLQRADRAPCARRTDSLFWKIAAVAPAQKTLVVSFSSVVFRWLVSRLMLHPHVRRARCGHSRQKQIFLTLCAEFDLALDELNRLGIEFVSFRENIDTGGPLGRAMVVIVGAIAELERSLIVERVKAGMRRAKLEGRQIGRKPLDIDREQVVRDRFSGMSLSHVAKKHRISRASVCRLVKESDATTHALNKAA
jgi:Resolvase, N terminal domain